MDKQTQQKSNPRVFISAVTEHYNDKVIEDAYIDAYSNLANGKSFCVEVSVVPVYGFFHKTTIGFECVVSVFETPQDLFDYSTERGEKVIEQFYSAI